MGKISKTIEVMNYSEPKKTSKTFIQKNHYAIERYAFLN